MSHWQRYDDIDEIPIRNADNVIVGYAYYKGYADLAVTEDDGIPALESIEAIRVKAYSGDNEGQLISLHESDPVFIAIELELKRRAAAGKIEFERSINFETDHDFQRSEYRAAAGY